LKDPVYREKNCHMPRIHDLDYTGVEELVLNYPTVLSDTEGFTVRAYSGVFSYVTGSEKFYNFTRMPVIAEKVVGEGLLVLVSDSSLFINSMLEYGDNMKLLGALSQGKALIDESHSDASRHTMVKRGIEYLYTALGNLEVRYGVALVVIYMLLKFKVEYDDPVNEVEAIMMAHPEYDRELVERLAEERRKIHGD
jgi:hypothetical protein